MKGFTLIELLVILAVGSIAIGISVNSFSSFNNSQVFNESISDVSNLLAVARSRAISQVKPSECGSTPLDGYEVRITIPGPFYDQSAVCGGLPFATQRKRLPQQVVFANSSATSILFDVSVGTVKTPGAIVLNGSGKTRTISVDKAGNIILSGSGSLPAATQPPPTSIPASAPGCSSSTAAYRLYPPSNCVYIAPGYGTFCNSFCNDGSVTPTVFAIVTLSSSPSTSQITATVTGTGCIPTGTVRFHADNSPYPFTAAGLSGTNPKTGTGSDSTLSAGSHLIRAVYISSTGCPGAESANITHIAN